MDDYDVDVDYLIEQADRDLLGVLVVTSALLAGIFSSVGGLLWFALT